VLLVNLLAALNFANVFFNKKRLENEKNVKNAKRDQNDQNKNVKTFLHLCWYVREAWMRCTVRSSQLLAGRYGVVSSDGQLT